jgi:hypothetical protein
MYFIFFISIAQVLCLISFFFQTSVDDEDARSGAPIEPEQTQTATRSHYEYIHSSISSKNQFLQAKTIISHAKYKSTRLNMPQTFFTTKQHNHFGSQG